VQPRACTTIEPGIAVQAAEARLEVGMRSRLRQPDPQKVHANRPLRKLPRAKRVRQRGSSSHSQMIGIDLKSHIRAVS
jgi:hypothetical protein